MIIGGYFTIANGTNVNFGIARVYPDGEIDRTFNATLGASNPAMNLFGGVSAIAVRPDGKVIIAGNFTTVNGMPRQNVARLNADGSLDASFHPAGAIDGYVYSALVQPDGKVLVAGLFTTANRANSSIARLNVNGSLDTGFRSGTDLYDSVRSLALQADGKVLVAGAVDDLGWAGERLTRLNTDGTRDAGFHPTTAGLGAWVRAIAVQADGNVLIGGHFTTVDGVMRPGIARLYGGAFPLALSIRRQDERVIVSWSATGLDTQLQQSGGLALPGSWAPVTQPVVADAGRFWVHVPITADKMFFRLVSPPSIP